MAKKVLIIDEVHPSLAKELRSLGFEVDEQLAIHPKDVSLTHYQGLVLRSKMPYFQAHLGKYFQKIVLRKH